MDYLLEVNSIYTVVTAHVSSKPFRHLIVQLIATDALTVKVRLLRAIGGNGAVLTAVIPELTTLLGDQPPVVQLSTADAAARFNMVFTQFVGALSTDSTPLTLFIDDIQWADSGSLTLLLLLFSQPSSHLLLIVAYRANEVDQAHPVQRFLQAAQEEEDEMRVR